MDSFFDYDFHWDVDPLPVNQSAFVPYINQRESGDGLILMTTPEKKSMNVKNRMMEFLKKNWTPVSISAVEAEKERNRKHMMNERIRREKEKQFYNKLRKLLPQDTKRDKKSIVQMAARKIEELESNKAKLQKRNKEILENINVAKTSEQLGGRSNALMEEAKIKIKVANPASGIDSMLEVLYCLKNKCSIATSIQSSFSSMEFSSVLQIKTSIKAAEVENAVERALFEVERKFRCPNMEDLDKHTSASIIK